MELETAGWGGDGLLILSYDGSLTTKCALESLLEMSLHERLTSEDRHIKFNFPDRS